MRNLILVVGLWCSGSATAESVTSLGVEAHGGMSTPFGFGGVALDASFGRFAATLGVGLAPMVETRDDAGDIEEHRMQEGLQVRYRFYQKQDYTGGVWAFAIGANVGAGALERDHVGARQFAGYLTKRWDNAVKVGGGVSLEYLWKHGVYLRGSLGAAVVTNASDFQCIYVNAQSYEQLCKEEQQSTVGDALGDPGTVLPYLGLAVGYDFFHDKRISGVAATR